MSAKEVGQLDRAEIHRRIQLPFRKAVEISLKSIKIRFWRSMITAAGIFLGIAFFASVRMSAAFTEIQHEVVLAKESAIRAGTLKPTEEDTRQITAAATDSHEEKAASNRLRWLSIMALVVCTVGITNAMLMSVTERYKEIGTMKCLGALDTFVVKLFFIEAFLLGFLASIVGFFLGWSAVSLLHLATDGLAVFGSHYWIASLRLLGISVGIGTALTLLATIFPARNAARMPAAAALRMEI